MVLDSSQNSINGRFGIQRLGIHIRLDAIYRNTGWALRPPLMILLATNSTKPLPGTTLDNDNPWNDKLRMIRYDEQAHDWLISTSEVSTLLKISLPSQHLSPQHPQ